MKTINYLSIIFLSYNVISVLGLLFCLRYSKIPITDIIRKYLVVILLISSHSLYLLFKLYIFEGRNLFYTIPLSLLYGPLLYPIIFLGQKPQSKYKKLLHFIPFIAVSLFLSAVFIYSSNYSEWNDIARITLHMTTALSFLTYGLIFLINFFKEDLIKREEKESFLMIRCGSCFILISFIHIGFLLNYNSKNTVHSPILLHFILMVFLMILLIRLTKISESNIVGVEKESYVEKTQEKYSKSKLSHETLKLYEQAILSLDDNFFYDSNLSLSKLEDHLKIKKYYLTQVFSICLNTSFITYCNEKKIAYAMKLFKANPNSKISEVSYEVGFNSPQRFNKAFTDISGMRAKDYRDSLKNNLSN